VTQAHTLARQEPQAGQYVGGELVYPWVQGHVYTIYLSPTKGTGLFLAPGDVLVKGLFLNPEAFEVTTQRAGAGDDAFDALVIRPTQPSGDADAFLLTTSGRRYLLHFVVGKQGMLAVTFTAPRLARPPMVAPEEPALVLPKPPA
jgi:type IV secretory pathway VirB9-like protein